MILGPQAKREIMAEPARYEGLGLAKAGQILGWVNLGLTAAFIVLLIVLAIVGASTSTTSTYSSLAAFAG